MTVCVCVFCMITAVMVAQAQCLAQCKSETGEETGACRRKNREKTSVMKKWTVKDKVTGEQLRCN